jgi:LAO/AO transport system kinase
LPVAVPELTDLVARGLAGEQQAVARLISVVERGGQEAWAALSQLYPHTGRAQLVGITGAPGSGKSTLVAEMAKAYRRRDRSVGIIAVDPTSPYSGGALLGDRIRMQQLATDSQVFIRSMATRGSLGGLALATADAAHVLDAAGFSVVLIETVGAGQSEVDIARVAHTTVVLQTPASGDEIQAIKAGILEIADILVVNKADLSGADNTVAALQAIVGLNSDHSEWHHGERERVAGAGSADSEGETSWPVPVLKTAALQGTGVEELLQAIDAHWQHMDASGQRDRRERERAEDQLQRILRHELLARLQHRVGRAQWARAVDRIASRKEDAHEAADRLIDTLSKGEGECGCS